MSSRSLAVMIADALIAEHGEGARGYDPSKTHLTNGVE